MPIYPYHCDSCDHQFEKLQKISEPLLTICPECGEDKLRKLVTAAGFQLKGSGWYVTDFRDKKPDSKDDDAKNPSKDTANKNIAAEPTSTAPTEKAPAATKGNAEKKAGKPLSTKKTESSS